MARNFFYRSGSLYCVKNSMMSATTKKIFFVLSVTCIFVILMEENMQSKLYSLFHHGEVSNRRVKKDSNIARDVKVPVGIRKTKDLPGQKILDMPSHSVRLESESSSTSKPNSSSTEYGRVDNTLRESISKETVSNEMVTSMTEKSNDYSMDADDDTSDTESDQSQNDPEGDEKDKEDSDVDDDDENEDDTDEYERLQASPYIYNEKAKERQTAPVIQGSTKYIAQYAADSRQDYWGGIGGFSQCTYNKCVWNNNMSAAHAVIFVEGMVRRAEIPPLNKPKNQSWILFTADPLTAPAMFKRPDVISSFNLTMTYQHDADIPMLFGRLRGQTPPAKDYEKIYDSKTKDVAWFVSHCNARSGRDQYVARMQKIVNVDIFGQCGSLKCGPGHQRTDDKSVCFPMLSKTYKFYLAFENAFCHDYVSEKFFKLFKENVDVIPVVRGGFDYKKYLPSGIFVDAADFKSPEALATYLVRLGRNKKDYVKMLKKKNSWRHDKAGERFFCEVCRYLHTHDKKRFHENLMEEYYGTTQHCWHQDF